MGVQPVQPGGRTLLMMHNRAVYFVAALALCATATGTRASATLETVVGQRVVVTDKTESDCNARAKSALGSVMQSVVEAGEGSGKWLGTSNTGGSPTASAVIECHNLDSGGYAASFTCATQVPPADHAAALCDKLSAAFNAATAAANAGGAK